MKFVSLVIIGMFISFSASAQTTGNATEKTVVQKQQKKKSQKSKSSRKKLPAATNVDVVTLKDERAHKAKWTFEEMLKRRLEVDAADSETARQRPLE